MLISVSSSTLVVSVAGSPMDEHEPSPTIFVKCTHRIDIKIMKLLALRSCLLFFFFSCDVNSHGGHWAYSHGCAFTKFLLT